MNDENLVSKLPLHVREDGSFKILVMTDIQESPAYDSRTPGAVNKMLDYTKPDLVILNGDNIVDCRSLSQYRETLDIFVSPMEKRGIPWSHVFGNHDEECNHGLKKEELQQIYTAYPHSVAKSVSGISGCGTHMLPVAGNTENIAFALYAIDSGAYLKEFPYDGDIYKDAVLEHPMAGNSPFGVIGFDRVAWYYNFSKELELRCGHKVPSLMFFHICLPEFGLIPENPGKTGMTGEKNESICPGILNSGMFSAAVQRGDVMGIYCGHDHVNTYEGKYLGIHLGFCGSMGYGTYGLEGDDTARNRLRGARLITLHESDPRHFESEYIVSSSL